MKARHFIFFILSILFTSCAKDIVDLTGDISGIVKDYATGELIEGCTITLSPGGKSASTDAKGNFSFEGLAPETYTLTYSKSGYEDQTGEVTVTIGKISSVTISLKSKGAIAGTVKSADNDKPVQNCLISIAPGGKSVLTDAKGLFTFDDLAEGSYTLTYSKEQYKEHSENIEVTSGKTTSVSVLLVPASSTLGAISGIVKGAEDGQLIANCQVTLSPGGKSVVTSNSGTYEFQSLEPGQYSLTFTKTGYNDENRQVTVKAGETATADAILKSKSAFAISEASYDFGDLEVTKTFNCFNNSSSDCSYTVSNIPYWASINKIEGIVKAGANDSFTITVDRNAVSEGEYSQNITVSYSGKTNGSENILIKMKKVKLKAPTVTTASSATNITQTSFDIDGALAATGGSQIIAYGHCWSTLPDPTVYDNKTDLGVTNQISSFKSNITGLTTLTTYYVRAYATNAQGTSYSEQVTVTTQDAASDKWDGNLASSFAGGSGTMVDPYIIKTGGQLLLMKDYDDSYFELANNINLDNRNWLPFDFRGTFDGKGYTISNLKVSRSDDNQGLFSTLGGTVRNLTISGVDIQAASNNNIGAIAGLSDSKSSIENCNVFFGSNSKITGNSNVGGLIGTIDYMDFDDDFRLSRCTINSTSNGNVILGNSNVGGLIGSITESYLDMAIIEDCNVSAGIYGGRSVGGITGYIHMNHPCNIQSCSYKGKISGISQIGGIAGVVYGSYSDFSVAIKGCKADIALNVTEDYAGGLIAFIQFGPVDIYGSYATGTMTGNTGAKYTGGLAGKDNNDRTTLYLCYSTVASDIKNFGGLKCYTASLIDAIDCASVFKDNTSGLTNCSTECTDITTFLRECYSEHASYYNFNSTWIWTGTVNGSTVSVSCPKLAWE